MAKTNHTPSRIEAAVQAPSNRNDINQQPDMTHVNGWEQSLHLSSARLVGILDTAGDAIIAVDSQQSITLFNQAAAQSFGYTDQEVFGQSMLMLLPVRFRDLYNNLVTSIKLAPQKVQRQAISCLRKDGTEFPAEVSITTFELANAATYTIILRDISAHQASEQALLAENLGLEQATRAKERFLMRMSHELRTPLNAIIGFTGTLLMRLPGPLNADQDRQLHTVQASAKHLLTLINSLLDLARIESGKIELDSEPVVCQAVIAEVAAALRPLAERKGLRIETHAPAQELRLITDQRMLSQILIHLVNNAISFTDAGTIILEVDINRRHPSADDLTNLPVIGQPESLIEFRVADTGIGIPSQAQAQMFEAFTESQTSTRVYAGTGLGLHLSQKLAELLGGEIKLSSQLGRGSTFMLILPGP